MSEVIKPTPNLDPNRDYFKRYLRRYSSLIDDILSLNHISPISHPRHIDLFSGNGAVADYFQSRLGWQLSTAIDQHLPNPNLIPSATWLYYDLDLLVRQIDHNNPPSSILPFHQHYDLLTSFFGILSIERQKELAKFFLRPGGFYIIDGSFGQT